MAVQAGDMAGIDRSQYIQGDIIHLDTLLTLLILRGYGRDYRQVIKTLPGGHRIIEQVEATMIHRIRQNSKQPTAEI